MAKAARKGTWQFAPRFPHGAFGWCAEPAIIHLQEALAEIKACNRKDPLLAAEGAVL